MNTLAKIKTRSRAIPRSGQALVEVMVAVAILTVGFLGIVNLLSRALALNRVVADNYVATYLAAEGIEVTKNIIDGNTIQGGPGLWSSGNGVGSCDGNIADGLGACQVQHDSPSLEDNTDQVLNFDANTNLYDYNSNATPTSFRRWITIKLVTQNELKVQSRVTWITRGGGTSEVTLEDHFYNWRQ